MIAPFRWNICLKCQKHEHDQNLKTSKKKEVYRLILGIVLSVITSTVLGVGTYLLLSNQLSEEVALWASTVVMTICLLRAVAYAGISSDQ
jgi:undecaprenyl pyrophosphate phosphatase UppP